jgi:hypothetical protein
VLTFSVEVYIGMKTHVQSKDYADYVVVKEFVVLVV